MPKIKIFPNEKKEPLGDLYGLFFEDLNHAADGGLYAEMIHNRSFELCKLDNPTYHALYAWEDEEGNDLVERAGERRVLSDDPIHPKNNHYLKVNTRNQQVIVNRGYNQGLYFKQGENYDVSFFAKPDFIEQSLIVQLRDASGKIFGEQKITIDQPDWTQYQMEMSPNQTVTNGRFAIVFPGSTDIALDMISVFPKETFKRRKNGCRKDLAEKLAEMKPKFMRFPGGCLVHDGSLNSDDHDSMYRWKNTIGPVETRPTKRTAWGYNQSLGLGFFEYFQLCEDLGAKPIPVLPAGWNPHHQRAVPIDELGPWIQDAIDLIEFANGPAKSKWGKIRAEMGHANSFNLEYLAIGNEEVGQPFFDRYNLFHEALRKLHPEIKLVNSAGPFAAGSEYQRGWNNAIENASDLVDEHYYASPEWFIANHHRYDNFDPKGPKVFLGEYAAKTNTWKSALAEASYMIGLERNADKVALACYAPLFSNVDYVNWRPDLIWFNQEKVIGSVNYDVQKLFMKYQGTQNIAFEINEMVASKVVDEKSIIGDFAIRGDGADITVTNLRLTNLKTGEVKNYPTSELRDNQQLTLGTMNDHHYAIDFDFIKTGGRWDKGFQFIFGYENSDRYYSWSLGGWQNQDCLLSSHRNGLDSVLTQSIWQVDTNRTYRCRLEIKHRKITTVIDDVIFNETEDLPLAIKPAYINAVYDELTDMYVLKVVNVHDEAFEFKLENSFNSIKKIQLTAALNAENTLDDDKKIKIIQEKGINSDQNFVVSQYSIVFLVMTE